MRKQVNKEDKKKMEGKRGNINLLFASFRRHVQDFLRRVERGEVSRDENLVAMHINHRCLALPAWESLVQVLGPVLSVGQQRFFFPAFKLRREKTKFCSTCLKTSRAGSTISLPHWKGKLKEKWLILDSLIQQAPDRKCVFSQTF